MFRMASKSLFPTFIKVCRVIPAGRVRIEKGRCFLKKMRVHMGKPDAARLDSSAR